MPNSNLFILIIIFILGQCKVAFSQSDKEYIFYSNVEDIEQFDSLISKVDDSKKLTLVSMGDNNQEVLARLKKKYKKSKHIFLLGDAKAFLSEEAGVLSKKKASKITCCLLYTSPSPRDS